MLTHIVHHIFRMPRPTNVKLGVRMENNDRISHRRHDLQGQRSRSQCHVISLSRVGVMAHESKTNRTSRSINKIGRREPYGTCYIAHKFRGQKVKDQGHGTTNADIQNVPYLPNGKVY